MSQTSPILMLQVHIRSMADTDMADTAVTEITESTADTVITVMATVTVQSTPNPLKLKKRPVNKV